MEAKAQDLATDDTWQAGFAVPSTQFGESTAELVAAVTAQGHEAG
jgi:hypothetical protein